MMIYIAKIFYMSIQVSNYWQLSFIMLYALFTSLDHFNHYFY